MFSYQYIPHVATAIFVLLMAFLVIYLIRTTLKEKIAEEKFDKQLSYTLNPYTEKEKEEEDSFILTQLRAIPELMIKAEFMSEGQTVESLEARVFGVAGVILLGTTMMTRNFIAGFVPVLLLLVGIVGFCMFKISKKANLIEDQIPAFVATVKANIQAKQHAQNAIVGAIENTSSPLYDELAYAKAIMEAGDFRAGIIALRNNTENDTLRQLASCIELASSSGSNIEKQIVIIENIIEDKQALERKKKLGINENRSLFIVAALFVPVAFVGSYFLSDMHRDYWFTTPTSWLILFGVVIAMIISIFATWKVIKKVDTY